MIFYLKAYNFAQGSDLSRTHTGADVNAVPDRALFRNEKTDPVLQGRRLAAERKRFLRSSLSLVPHLRRPGSPLSRLRILSEARRLA